MGNKFSTIGKDEDHVREEISADDIVKKHDFNHKKTLDASHQEQVNLQGQISSESTRKIEVLTGINLDGLLGDVTQLATAIEGISAFFEGKNDRMQELERLFEPLGVDRDEIEATLNNAASNEEEDAPAEHVEEQNYSDESAQSKPKKLPWQPSKKSIDYKTSWNQRYIALRAKERIDEQKLMPYLIEAEKKYGIPVSTLVAIMMKESSMNPLAKNKKSNARGLAQVMRGTLADYKTDVEAEVASKKARGIAIDPRDLNFDPFNPRTGIMITAWHARKRIREVENAVARGKCIVRINGEKKEIPVNASALIDLSDVESIYITHNSGSAGYLAYRNMLVAEESGDPKKIAAAKELLFGFQRIPRKGKPDWQNRAHYARQVAEVAYHWQSLISKQDIS